MGFEAKFVLASWAYSTASASIATGAATTWVVCTLATGWGGGVGRVVVELLPHGLVACFRCRYPALSVQSSEIAGWLGHMGFVMFGVLDKVAESIEGPGGSSRLFLACVVKVVC